PRRARADARQQPEPGVHARGLTHRAREARARDEARRHPASAPRDETNVGRRVCGLGPGPLALAPAAMGPWRDAASCWGEARGETRARPDAAPGTFDYIIFVCLPRTGSRSFVRAQRAV